MRLRRLFPQPAPVLLQRLIAAPSSVDQQHVPSVFASLLAHFYFEVFLWIYLNVLLHPRSQLTRNRLKFVALLSGQSLEDAAMELLSGYFEQFQQARRPLVHQVYAALERISTEQGNNAEQCAQLRQLSIELGLHLNPRQMLRAFSAVVCENLARRSSQQG